MCEKHQTDRGGEKIKFKKSEPQKFPSKFLFFICKIKIMFSPANLVIFDVVYVCSCCIVLITCGQFISEDSAGCVGRSLRSDNISDHKLPTKCDHSPNPVRAPFLGGNWITDTENPISVNHFQPKLISEM